MRVPIHGPGDSRSASPPTSPSILTLDGGRQPSRLLSGRFHVLTPRFAPMSKISAEEGLQVEVIALTRWTLDSFSW